MFTKYNRRATGENLINLLNANEYKWFKSNQIVVQMGWEYIQQHIFNCTFSQRTISYRLYVTMRKIYRYHLGYNFKNSIMSYVKKVCTEKSSHIAAGFGPWTTDRSSWKSSIRKTKIENSMNTSVMEHNLDIQNYMNVCLVHPRLFDQLVQSASEPLHWGRFSDRF